MEGSAKAQPSHIEIEQQLRQMNDEWVKALVRGDAATLDRIMGDDFVFTYPLEGNDKTQFITDVVSGDLTVEHLNRETVSVRVWGNTAVLTGLDLAQRFYQGLECTGKCMNVVI